MTIKQTEKSIGKRPKDAFKTKGWNRILQKIAKTAIVFEPMRDQEVIELRRDVCFDCDNRDKKNQVCKICSCFIEEKTASKINYNVVKMRTEVTHCPEGKWGDKEIADHYKNISNDSKEK